jgi:hypothetical protein
MRLYRAAGGGRLHIPPCPHVRGVELQEVLPGDERGQEICSWCEPEIAGQGRSYHPTLNDALRAFGSYSDTSAMIRGFAQGRRARRDLDPEQPLLCRARARRSDRAWFRKTYVRPAGRDGQQVELPGYEGGGAAGESDVNRVGAMCPTCFIEMPVTGVCANCA